MCLEARVTYDFPIFVDFIHTDVFDVGRKSFVQPQITPPIHGHDVSKPLEQSEIVIQNKIRQLMGIPFPASSPFQKSRLSSKMN